jgi:hypothetical protein
MSESPETPVPPRRPVIVPPAPPQKVRTAAGVPAVPAAPRVLSAGNGPRPVPGSIMRSLLSTRAWAVVCALGMLLAGVLLTIRAKTTWSQLDILEKLPLEEFGTLERLLNRGDAVVHFAIAVAFLYAVPRLFRYSGAIGRLREGRRMTELENALRHQRAVWTVFGAAGVLWILSFIGQVYFLVVTIQELQTISEDSDTYQIETAE